MRPAYPLVIGETTTDGLSYDNNGLYMYDILQDSLPQYEIGHIYNQTVDYTEKGHGFYIKADSLHSDYVTYSYETDSIPRGTIEFNGTTGRFKYYPLASDYLSFTVTFYATDGTETVSESVRFNLMPQVVPEQYAFQSQGIIPDGESYTLLAETKKDSILFNSEWRNIYSVSLSGKDIVFDNNVDNKVKGLSGREDINDLNIYAERLIIRSALTFPQTEVTIYAKELIFEDQGGVISSINTTPTLVDDRRGEGRNGANAGNIYLYVKELKADAAKRFILNGGNGQNSNREGTPGNGGNGGTITSNIDIGSYCDFARGCSGYRYDASTTSEDHYGAIIGAGLIGNTGQFVLEDAPYKYLHPYYIAPVIRFVTDAYINNYTSTSLQICKEYSRQIEEYFDSKDYDSEEDMELRSDLTEFGGLLNSLEMGLDYFGNSAGWTPLLSFEVMLQNYQEEIDRSIPTLYLYYWLTKVDRTLQEWAEAKQLLANQAEQEIEDCRANINKLTAEIPILLDNIDEVNHDIAEVNAKIDQLEAYLLSKAKKKVKKQKKIQKVASVCKAITSVASFCGPYGAALGTALNTASNVASKVAQVSGKLGIDADYTRFFPEVDIKTYSIADMLDSVKTSLNGIPWTTLKEDAKYLSTQYKSLSKTLSPLISTIGDVRDVFRNNSVSDEEVNQVFQALCAESPEWNALQADLTNLNNKKQGLITQLNDVYVTIPQVAATISVGILSLDAFRRDAIENNSKRDLYAMQYLEKMEQRAKNRLLKYHYYLRKAYEYRMLKPYEGEYNIVKMFESFEKLASSLNYNPMENLTNYEALSSPFYDVVSGIAEEIIDEYSNNYPEQSAPITIVIPKEKLDLINADESYSLNFYDMGIFAPDEENVRIVDLGIQHIETHVDGNVGYSGYMDLNMTHSGISRFRKDGQIYWFDHRSKSTTSPHTWGLRYDAVSKESTNIQPSAASESLLASILKNSGNIMLFSRPAAWGDVTLSKKVHTSGGADVVIDSLVLRLQYDFTRRPNKLRNIDITTNEGLPYIACSVEDVNGRSNGNGVLNRSYAISNQTVTFTAIEQYGSYHFANWTDRGGNIVSDKQKLTVARSTDQFYRANYERRVPILNVPDTIKVGHSGGTHIVSISNAGSDDIEMDWYVSDSLSTWIHLEGVAEGVDNGTFTFAFDANTTGNERVDSLEIFAPETDIMSKIIYIVQTNDINEQPVSNTSLSASDITGREDEEVELPITLDNAEFGENVVGVSFTLQLPEGVSVVLDDDDDPVWSFVSERVNKKQFNVTPAQYADGTWGFRVYTTSASGIIKGTSGAFMTLTLKVAAGVEDGEYTIKLKDNKLSVKDATNNVSSVTLADATSTLTIENYVLGDVNADGEIDLSDAIMVTYYSLHIVPSGFILKAADMNADGEVDLSDAIIIIYKSLGVIESRSMQPANEIWYANDYLQMDADANGFSVSLTNEGQYLGMQYDLVLPEGMTLEDVTLNKSRAAGHTVMWNRLEDGSYRVLAFSTNGTPFFGNMGELLNLRLSGNHSGQVRMENIFFVGIDLQKHRFEDLYLQATGICEREKGIVKSGEAVYDLQGRKVTTPRKGLYLKGNNKYLVK